VKEKRKMILEQNDQLVLQGQHVFVAGSLVGACNYARPFFHDLLLFSVCLCVTVVKRKNMW
jgi:hypothetical protein